MKDITIIIIIINHPPVITIIIIIITILVENHYHNAHVSSACLPMQHPTSSQNPFEIIAEKMIDQFVEKKRIPNHMGRFS